MAVLFPTPVGYTLKPNKPGELLQGFLNIQNVEGAQNGQLTKSQLNSYNQKQFFGPDPSNSVANYLSQNFDAIARRDGNASSISVDDLVRLNSGLPTPPATPVNPPPQNPPVNNNNPQVIMLVLLQFIQQIFLGFSPANNQA